MCKRLCFSFFVPFLDGVGESVARLADKLGVEVRELFDEPQSREVRVGRPPRER